MWVGVLEEFALSDERMHQVNIFLRIHWFPYRASQTIYNCLGRVNIFTQKASQIIGVMEDDRTVENIMFPVLQSERFCCFQLSMHKLLFHIIMKMDLLRSF